MPVFLLHFSQVFISMKLKILHDRGPYHIETNFYIIRTSVMKELHSIFLIVGLNTGYHIWVEKWKTKFIFFYRILYCFVGCWNFVTLKLAPSFDVDCNDDELIVIAAFYRDIFLSHDAQSASFAPDSSLSFFLQFTLLQTWNIFIWPFRIFAPQNFPSTLFL